MDYVTYYRVSTRGQGATGLGLDAQKESAKRFVQARKGKIIAEFQEVESGKNDSRVELQNAINYAKKEGAKLLIAKLDRLSRNASFIFKLRDEKVDFVCADLPDANTLTIGIFATLAQHERELISSRTKDAIKEVKRRWLKSELNMSLDEYKALPDDKRKEINQMEGYPLGNANNLTDKSRKRSQAAIKRNREENENWNRAKGYIVALRNGGKTFASIADTLNKEGFKTRKEKEFTPMTVKRLFDRVASA